MFPENVVLVGPAGTGKSHILLGLGEAAVVRGWKVRYLPAAALVEIPNAGGCRSAQILPDPAQLYRVRRQLAAAIESLSQ